MPELPEVETIRRDLVPALRGSLICQVWSSEMPLRGGQRLDYPTLASACVGRRFVEVRRRGKYLLLEVEGESTIVAHLGMSGRLLVTPAGEPRALHTHVVWSLERPSSGRGRRRGTGRTPAKNELRFVDPRRFGVVMVVPSRSELAVPPLASLGVEPLGSELTSATLLRLAAGTRQSVKTFLLDQSQIAGLGNIYVCEALFEARIHPETPACSLGPQQAATLRRAIVKVLQRSISNRGTTFRDFVDATGTAGTNQHTLRVYGRQGEPCPRRDGGQIVRLPQNGRSTYLCPVCQPSLPGLPSLKARRTRSPKSVDASEALER
ncbi:MAG: bifunctional DNA-formamidopyrimidine glycosylase/DNA-(apurinic or apyrimidinic site) lyase [Pseudomonadota bacterium]